MTTYHTYDAPPAPSDFELQAPDPRNDKPTTRCGFNYYCRLRHVNGDRDRFHAYLEREERNGQTLQLWQWDSLLEMYEAQDERDTMLDARYA